MPFNGSGTWSNAGTSFSTPVTGTTISATAAQTFFSDLASNGLSACITKSGQTTVTANIPMSGFKFTGLAAGSANGDSLRYEQGVQAILTTTGDQMQASAANTPARLPAAATVAAHATTMNPWVARIVTLSGGAVTFTDIADADFVGQQVLLIMNAAHVWTDGAVFDVQGGANYTCTAGDQILLTATAVDAFDVTIFPAAGNIALSAEQASTSGTSIDFTGIPPGTKRITINFVGVSTNGTSNHLVQIGDSGGVEASGYLGAGTFTGSGGTGSANYTTGFGWTNANASTVLHGSVVLTLEDAAGFTWCASGILGLSDSAFLFITGGSKSLSAELDRVRITTLNGTDVFDAGAISISCER